LQPAVGKRFATERKNNVVGDEIAGGEEDAPPYQPRHAEYLPEEEENGVLDQRDAPGVDVHVGEGDLDMLVRIPQEHWA
jgi:hypothetical protein